MSWKLKLRAWHPAWGEAVIQSIEQPLHILMTFSSVVLIAYLVGFMTVDLAIEEPRAHAVEATIAVIATVIWVGIREYRQWPSSRKWDPWLDWAFELCGVALGVVYLIN